MDRIKRLSYDVLDKHKPKFGESFSDNKKILGEVAIIRSKGLKNEIAGYITKFIKKEIRDMKTKQAQIDAAHANELAEQAAKVTQEEQAVETEQVVGEIEIEKPVEATETQETEQVVGEIEIEKPVEATETQETEQVVGEIEIEKPVEVEQATEAQEESELPEAAASTDNAATKAE